MTSASSGASVPGGSGGRVAAGTAPAGDPLPPLPEDESLAAAAARVEEEAEDHAPPAGPLGNLLTALVVIALGAAAVVGSTGLGLGSAGQPRAGTWPLLVSGTIVVLGVALALLARRTTDAERFTRASLAVLAGLATMVGFVALVGVVGFEIPAALLTFVWLRFLGHESWRVSLITTLGVVVAFYLIFVVALSVPIPHLF